MPLCGNPQSIQLSTALAVSGSLAVLLWYVIQRRRKHGLPGPTSLPLVGNFIQLVTNRDCIPQLFNRWTDEYGPLFVIRIGRLDVIVINTMDLIREAFSVRAVVFSDRPCSLPLIKKVYQGLGLTWQNGDDWKQLRSAAWKAVRCCGPDSRCMEERIIYEVEKLIHELSDAEAAGHPFDPSTILHEAVTNVLCSALFGVRFKYGSKRLKTLVRMTRCNLSNSNIFHSANVFQFLSAKCQMDFGTVPLTHGDKKRCSFPANPCKSPDDDRKTKEQIVDAVENAKNFLNFIGEEIERHREDFNPNCLRDFIDEYLSSTLGGRCKKKTISRQNIEAMIMDLFTFGTEPTSAVLRWLVLVMVELPEIQQKCHEELDRVVGCGRLVCLNDEDSLPYVRATIHEAMRRFTPMPLGIPHMTRTDTCLCDIEIPAKTVIICNHHAVHMNAHYFMDPCKFCPERFLDNDTGSCPEFKPPEAFIAFGVGPRSCAGSSLSSKMIFLMFANLLQRFEFVKSCECDESSTEFHGTYDVVYSPQPFKIRLLVH